MNQAKDEESERHWYVGVHVNYWGPFDVSEILIGIQEGKWSWTDYLLSPKLEFKWKRICEWPEFFLKLPFPPLPQVKEKIRQAQLEPRQPTSKEDVRFLAKEMSGGGVTPRGAWFLQFNGSRFGPFSLSEAQIVIQSGRLEGDVFAWRSGMSQWKSVSELDELSQLNTFIEKVRAGDDQARGMRRQERMPLIATVQFSLAGDTRGESLATGVCQNISQGGIMVKSSSIPGYRGAQTRLLIAPIAESGITPFEAQGTVAWVAVGDKAFSVKFDTLSTETLAEIRDYMKRQKARTK